MSKIEVGEFVRTKSGIIIDADIIIDLKNVEEMKDFINNEIVKHSYNIIDLIEVGDIVHTKDVLNEYITHIWSKEYLEALKEDIGNGIKLVEVLTHEQFTQNAYEVEE